VDVHDEGYCSTQIFVDDAVSSARMSAYFKFGEIP
jgi:hypothetical protein